MVLKNARIGDTVTDITVECGRIAAIGRTDEDGTDLCGRRVYPGLIDVHIHGCMGQDVSDREDNLAFMAEHLLRHGTTSWCPTTMTVSSDDIVAATHKSTDFECGAEVIGFHLEGPFINPTKLGAQNPAHVFRPTLQLLERCKSVTRVTIAPELPGSKAFIEGAGCQVSLGHSDADYDTAKGAFRAGVSCLTHTFNAMRGIHHRDPGPILAARESEGVYAELIADGKHVHPAAMRMLIDLMGDDRVVLVSDAVRALGMPDGEYELGGMNIVITNGTAYTADMHLAGSTSYLFDCVKTLIGCGISPDRAVKMASENPARMLGLKKGKIDVGYDADLIAVSEDFSLDFVIKGGTVYDVRMEK